MPHEAKKKKEPLPFRLRISLRCQHRKIDDGASTSTSESTTPSPSTSESTTPTKKKSKAQNWRDKVKATNPAKYMELKKTAQQYSTYYRLQCAMAEDTLKKRNLSAKEREEAMKWSKRKETNNKGARERMKKMNKRKSTEKSANSANNKSQKKVQTRKQHDAASSKERIKKARQRAAHLPERRAAVNARSRELYAQKRDASKALEEKQKKLMEKEERLKEMEALLNAKEAELEGKAKLLQNRNNLLPDEDTLDLRSTEARDKAFRRAKKALPRRRSHCINTSLDLINKASPQKAAAFSEAGIRSKNRLEDGIMEAVGTALQAPRNSRKRKLLASSMSTIKKHKLQRAACRKFRLSRKLLANAHKRVAGRKPVSTSTVKMIENFYEVNSNPLPDKKLVSKKTFKPRHVMDTTIGSLHENYNKTHPGNEVCASVFYRHRPKHVRSKSGANYIGCLCEYCENINLKLDAINRLQPASFKDIYHVTAATMCPKPSDSEFYLPSCIARTCDQCGLDKLDTVVAPLLTNPTREVEWKRWDIVVTTCYTKKQPKSVKKRALVVKSSMLADLVKELKDEVKPFAMHLFNKDWQHQQQCQLKSQLHHDEVLGIFDFAENFKCEYQREVQSAYYSHESATVHPIVMYYLCNKCLEPVTESCIMVSNDLTHDYNLVNTFQQVVVRHLTTTRELTLSRFFRFSDGCSAQYKSKGPISDISYAREDFGFVIHHNYSGTRHGKGASDGESGVVKRHAAEAIKAGTAIINNSRSLFDYLSQNLVKEAPHGSCCASFRRTIFFVPFEDVERDRPGRVVKTVTDTRKHHSIKSVKGGVVATRNLSCFCDPCLRGFGECKNTMYVHPWKEFRLHNTKTKRGKGTRAGASQDPAPARQDTAPARQDTAPAQASQDTAPAQASQEPAPASQDTAPAQASQDTAPAHASQEPAPASQDPAQASQDTTPAPASQKIKVNSYVAVRFDSPSDNMKQAFVYIAMVTDVKEKNLQLKFMRRNEKGLYDFTSEQEALHPFGDIVKLMVEPVMVEVGRRNSFMYYYKFSEQELKALGNKFSMK